MHQPGLTRPGPWTHLCRWCWGAAGARTRPGSPGITWAGDVEGLLVPGPGLGALDLPVHCVQAMLRGCWCQDQACGPWTHLSRWCWGAAGARTRPWGPGLTCAGDVEGLLVPGPGLGALLYEEWRELYGEAEICSGLATLAPRLESMEKVVVLNQRIRSFADPEWFIPDPDPAINFLRFRIWIQLFLIKHIFKYFVQKQPKFNQKIESTNYLPFFSYYSTHSPEFSGQKLKIKLSFFSIIFGWIRNINFESGSMRIRICNTGIQVRKYRNSSLFMSYHFCEDVRYTSFDKVLSYPQVQYKDWYQSRFLPCFLK